MKILVACQNSGITAEAFQKLGHEVFSYDLTLFKGTWQSWQKEVISNKWEMILAFPPMGDTGLINAIAGSSAPRIAIENGRQHLPSLGIVQIFRPFHAMKSTALWLRNLSPLMDRRHTETDKTEETESWLARTMAKSWG